MPRTRPAKKSMKARHTTMVMRRADVARMYCEGKSQAEIAELTGVGQPCICKDLAALREEWRRSATMAIDQRKWEELARIDNLERQAWEAWHRSCEDAVVERQEKAPPRRRKGEEDDYDPTPVVVKETRESRGQCGDPSFLARVSWCVETRLKILGIVKSDGTTINIDNKNENRVSWAELYSPPAHMTMRPQLPNPVEDRIAAELAGVPKAIEGGSA